MRDEHSGSRDSIEDLEGERRQIVEEFRLVAEIADQWELMVDFVVKL